MQNIFLKFLQRLILRPALWVAMFLGVIPILIDNDCNGFTPMFQIICDFPIFDHGNSMWRFASNVELLLIAILYITLRFFDAKNAWNQEYKINWGLEIALIFFGGWLGFIVLAVLALATANGI